MMNNIYRSTLTIVLAITISLSGLAQVNGILGPTCVTAGSASNYALTGDPGGFNYSITGGTLSTGGTTGSSTLQSKMIVVTWSSSGGTISLTSPTYNTSATVLIMSALVTGSLTYNATQSINSGVIPDSIKCSAGSGGGCGACKPNQVCVTYQWESSSDNSTWSSISGATSVNLGFNTGLTGTTWYYRRKVTGTSGASGYSPTAIINIYQPLQIGIIRPLSDIVYFGGTPNQLSLQSWSGGNGTYVFDWQQSTDNTTFTTLGAPNLSTYTPSFTIGTKYYRLAVSSNGQTLYTAGVSVKCWPQLVLGTPTPSTQSINYNTYSAALSLSSVTGGDGTYVYDWQYSPTINGTYTSTGTTSSTYTPGPLTTAGYYKVIVTSGQSSATAGPFTVNVYPQLMAGSASPATAATIVNSSNALTLSVSGISGGNGSYTYAWYKSTDGTTWNNTGMTGATYSVSNLAVSTYFKVQVTSNGVTGNSTSSLVQVYPVIQAGSINPAAQTIGMYRDGALLSVIGVSGGNSAYTYQWQSSSDNVQWQDISGATTTTYTPKTVVQKMWYRAVVTSLGVSTPGGSATVNTYPVLSGGTITPDNLTIPSGSSPGQLLGSSGTGGNCGGSYTYQWQQSTDGISFNSTGTTTASYSPGNLATATYFRRRVICGTDTSYSNICKASIGTISPTNNLNYIRVRDIRKPGVTDTVTANLLTDSREVHHSTQYFDGLGRPWQTVIKQASPLGKDIVTPNVYDAFGREAIQYQSYVSTASDGLFRPNAAVEDIAFNTTQYPGEQFYYSQTQFEVSPLNRVHATFATGNSWVGSNRGVVTNYQINSLQDSVRIWTIAGQGSLPVSSTYYGDGQLESTTRIDEDNHQVVEYIDKSGKLILKKVQYWNTPAAGHSGWLCTYYVYDLLDNRRFVIPPKAVAWLQSNNWSFAGTDGPTTADELCYRFEYDARLRLTIKKEPGSGEIRTVYDQRDRVAMTQDAVQRSQQQWVLSCYDALNRIDTLALMADPVHYNDQAWHQAQANTSTYFYYPNTSSYTVDVQLQTFYDNYDWLAPFGTSLSSTINTTYNTNPTYFLTTYNTAPNFAVPLAVYPISRGLMTGTRLKVIGTSQFLYNIPFYDDRSRIIQTETSNWSNGIDLETVQYDFNGKPLRRLFVQRKIGSNAQEHLVASRYTYDAGGRIVSTWKNMDGVERRLDTLIYNAVGQIRSKYLANNIDSLLYDYNIRGWITGINKDYLAGTADHWFGMELGYDKSSSVTGTAVFNSLQYNGNIAGTVWKSAGDGVAKKYDFTYDKVNRLMKADYTQLAGSAFAKSTLLDFTAQIDEYDENGNIKKMKQSGYKIGGSAPIDDLQYSYHQNSNKLKIVSDAANETSSMLGDFHYDPSTKDTVDYTYDGNGNLISDKNKGIRNIQYNFLNLPQVISFIKAGGGSRGNIQFRYDAAGNKILKIVTDSTVTPVRITNIQYDKEAQYQNDTLQIISHEEGRTIFGYQYYENGDSSYKPRYNYFERDNQGNIRTVLTEQQDTTRYMATMEAASRQKERAIFYNIDETSYPSSSVPGGFPSDGQPGTNDSVARVNGSLRSMGPGLLLKVTSGDSLMIGVNALFQSGGSTSQTQSSLPDILSSLAVGLVKMTAGTHGAIGDLNNTTSSPIFAALNSFNLGNITTPASTPKAYLNWMLLDNQFQYVSTDGQSGAQGILTPNVLNTKGKSLKLKKSGYLYVWVSNETKNWDVFFDKLTVRSFSGPLMEETHYYPFGLTMAGISDKALRPKYTENKLRYNSGSELHNKEFADSSGLEMYETRLRELDPQLGRWWQTDPKPNEAESPYAAMGNNPILNNDPMGDTLTPQQKAALIAMLRQHTREENRDGDQTGRIRNATHEEYKEDPWRALNKDIFHTLATGLGFNTADDESATIRAKWENRIPVGIDEYGVSLAQILLAFAHEKGGGPVELHISEELHPQSAAHAEADIKKGVLHEGVIDREGAAPRRSERMKGIETKPGKDRDEFPPAFMKTDSKDFSVWHIDKGDNRGAGASLGNQIRNLPDNTRVIIVIKKLKKDGE